MSAVPSPFAHADIAQRSRGGVILGSSAEDFTTLYNQRSFSFEHGLQHNRLFDLDSLADLSERRPSTVQFAYCSNGPVTVKDHWATNTVVAPSLRRSIMEIAHNDSLVMLKRVELDPVFAPLLESIFEEVQDRVGRVMRDDVLVGRGTILIASPGRITVYHIDSDVNFLFHIRGDKLLSVFDQRNREVLSEEELERYFDGDYGGASYHERKQSFATSYNLRAGLGVHVPCAAPHCAQNGATPSVALSVNFDLRSMVRSGRIYRMNHVLRQRGLQPRPPGSSALSDGLKLLSEGGLTAARSLLRRIKL